MQRVYKGKCPYTNDIQSIYVEYENIQMTQKLSQNYKKVRFDCEYIDECLYIETCPIYQDAPKSITE